MSFFERLAFSIPAFSVTPVLTRTNRVGYWKLSAFLPNIQNVVTNFSCWQCLCSLLGPISLLYKQLLQYTLLKSFTIPSALLTKFPKKFHVKLLASDIIFTKLSTKTLLLWRCRVSFEYQGLLQNTPASFLLFLSMFKLCCKRHYRNLATYSWCTAWREHVSKTAPARRRHSVGGGGVSKMAAAAHSSNMNNMIDEWCNLFVILAYSQTLCAYDFVLLGLEKMRSTVWS